MASNTNSQRAKTPSTVKRPSNTNQLQQQEGAETKYLKPYLTKYKFNMKELLMLRKRYVMMSRKGILDRKSFMDSLGLLGLETAAFLCNRIFDVIDEDGNQSCNFDEFLFYMNTLIYGDPKEKAMQSFKMLDVKKNGTIRKSELEEMINGVSQLWNSLTGSRVKPTSEYIQTIFNTFDVDKDGAVTFQDFERVYEMSSDIFGWFEFFNQEDEENIINAQKKKNSAKNPQLEVNKTDSLNDTGSHEHSEVLQGKLVVMEAEVAHLIKMFQLERQKSSNDNMQISRANSSVYSQQNSPGMKIKRSASKDSPTKFQSSTSTSPTKISNQNSLDKTPKTATKAGMIIKLEPLSRSRNPALGGPQFMHEGPMEGKGLDDDDDVLFTQRADSKSPSPKDRSRSPSPELQRDRSVSPSPFDYYNGNNRDDDSDDDEEDLDKISDLTSTKSFHEINSKLERLQEFILDMKGAVSVKSDYGGRSNASSTKGSEQEEFKSRALNFATKDQISQFGEIKTSQNQESQNQGNSNAVLPFNRQSSKKIVQVTTEPQITKPGERRPTLKNMGLESKEHRKNISVFFGHENWNLVLNMMVGLRASIKSISPRNVLEKLSENEFKLKSHYDLIQKRMAGFDIRKACRFYDFFPHVFEDIRRQFGINSRDFLKSCGPESLLGNLIIGNVSSLTELSSTGKSGSFFYFSEDGKYMLKTIPKREAISLKRIIRDYYYHIMGNQNTLIARIFGLYKMKFYLTKKKHTSIYFIVMGNLFSSDLTIDVRYDLKGSTHGRTSRKKGQVFDRAVAMKDLDFNEDGITIDLTPEDKEMLKKQIEFDAKFCAGAKVIDYSLLLGIHHIKIGDPFANPPPNYQTQSQTNFKSNSIQNSSQQGNNGLMQITTNQNVNLSNDPAKNQTITTQKQQRFYERYYGGMLSSDKKKVYVLGIIDMLTEYTAKKRAETVFKSTVFGKGISCVPPQNYADRFKNYLFSKIK